MKRTAGVNVGAPALPANYGVGKWCAPGDRQSPTWLLVFDDADRGINVYTDEHEAHSDFRRAENGGWNCRLFQLAERAAPGVTEAPAPDAWALADAAIAEAYPDIDGKGPGWWGQQRIANWGILRGAIVRAIQAARGVDPVEAQSSDGFYLATHDEVTAKLDGGEPRVLKAEHVASYVASGWKVRPALTAVCPECEAAHGVSGARDQTFPHEPPMKDSP